MTAYLIAQAVVWTLLTLFTAAVAFVAIDMPKPPRKLLAAWGCALLFCIAQIAIPVVLIT